MYGHPTSGGKSQKVDDAPHYTGRGAKSMTSYFLMVYWRFCFSYLISCACFFFCTAEKLTFVRTTNIKVFDMVLPRLRLIPLFCLESLSLPRERSKWDDDVVLLGTLSRYGLTFNDVLSTASGVCRVSERNKKETEARYLPHQQPGILHYGCQRKFCANAESLTVKRTTLKNAPSGASVVFFQKTVVLSGDPCAVINVSTTTGAPNLFVCGIYVVCLVTESAEVLFLYQY